jgi:hypothetical protein
LVGAGTGDSGVSFGREVVGDGDDSGDVGGAVVVDVAGVAGGGCGCGGGGRRGLLGGDGCGEDEEDRQGSTAEACGHQRWPSLRWDDCSLVETRRFSAEWSGSCARMLGMFKSLFRVVAGLIVCSYGVAGGQMPPGFPSGERVDADAALDRALKTSSLTKDGNPFHAVVEIGKPGEEYSGRVEVWWSAPEVYKLQISSAKFSQQKVVHRGKVWEKDDGDYYPRWLENFVLAVLDPLPVESNFRAHGGAVIVGDRITRSCLQRDDRPGGITDQMTWGEVCFTGAEPKLLSVLATNLNIEYDDWKGFGTKKIARTIKTDVEGFEEIVGRVTTLEELKPADSAMFEVEDVTPPEQRIATKYVSTLTEESMVEVKPDIQWPTVREGKTDGYMIVYARTDRTGQVRETAKHNSDQPGLEDFGMEAAKKYKFKPLVADGVPTQMEMPLVLHFTSKIEDPTPILSVEEMRKQMNGCRAGSLRAGSAKVTLKISVDEKGHMTGFSTVAGAQGHRGFRQLCRSEAASLSRM